MRPKVTATPEALEVIERLQRKHGRLAFFGSEGCRDGSAAMCLSRAEFLCTDDDVKLGVIGGCPFYVDRERYENWDEPELLIDVATGGAGIFSLEGLEEVHFVTRTAASDSVTNQRAD